MRASSRARSSSTADQLFVEGKQRREEEMKTGRQQIGEIVHVCRPTRQEDDGTGQRPSGGGVSRDGTAGWSTSALSRSAGGGGSGSLPEWE